MAITRQLRTTLAVLAAIGGELHEPGGSATTQLAEMVSAAGYQVSPVALTNNLIKWDQRGMVRRELRGKRTLTIGLGSEAPSEFHQAAERVRSGEYTPPPEPAGIPAPPPVPIPEVDYEKVAASVVDALLRHFDIAPQLTPAETNGEVEVLRQHIRELERQVAAYEAERHKVRAELELLTTDIRTLYAERS